MKSTTFQITFRSGTGAHLDTRTATSPADASHIAREMLADAWVLMPGDSITVTSNNES